MNPIRRQRLILVVLLVCGVGLAVTLMMLALKDNINHFYSPSRIVSGEAPLNSRFRAGGIVVPGSVSRDSGGLTVHFKITDGSAEVDVEYTGILPDLFRQGQSVVGTGKLDSQRRFVADEILAKHDENYMPPEVQKALENAAPHPIKKPGAEGGEE
ncbi:cytochrome C biogenesis protein CcmE [Endozoicomonas montiporae]|uniref:Cytochrome c-type biogenesis protein CcmE n=2 Tax=Endozoicomonas montiporae TaxID=1027273 RepID=A0A081N560_9GAMM|nr:cytochrome c maturation protein CcmE [Endozoicomonas montiporae]AMO57537.1 cytochrome c-type biogenesis protein CcmE [Endozoicomonas montiporae CL-33]KEQ13583.1 cytochrome C biogenesis protein CcmE [Endozoicomonas montiporae]